MMNVRVLSIILILLFLLLQYKLWLANDGFLQTIHLKKAISAQMEDNQLLKKRADRLAEQDKELLRGQGSIEALAREELGMVKGDEQYYQFVGS